MTHISKYMLLELGFMDRSPFANLMGPLSDHEQMQKRRQLELAALELV